jgi:hypothetical protein
VIDEEQMVEVALTASRLSVVPHLIHRTPPPPGAGHQRLSGLPNTAVTAA